MKKIYFYLKFLIKLNFFFNFFFFNQVKKCGTGLICKYILNIQINILKKFLIKNKREKKNKNFKWLNSG
jgi:hypothetical protein